MASQSTLARFFHGCGSATAKRRCFRPLWQWCGGRLPRRAGGDTLDRDSPRRLHEEGRREGVAVGGAKRGLTPCLHPLLAVVAAARLVGPLWLRPVHASCGNNAVAFVLDRWEQRPQHNRRRGVRATTGCCPPELLARWERLRLSYVVVAPLSQPMQRLRRGDWVGPATEGPGAEVAECAYQALGLAARAALGVAPASGGRNGAAG